MCGLILKRLKEAGFRVTEKINEAIESHAPRLLAEVQERERVLHAVQRADVAVVKQVSDAVVRRTAATARRRRA